MHKGTGEQSLSVPKANEIVSAGWGIHYFQSPSLSRGILCIQLLMGAVRGCLGPRRFRELTCIIFYVLAGNGRTSI